jgi:hypothetical protein
MIQAAYFTGSIHIYPLYTKTWLMVDCVRGATSDIEIGKPKTHKSITE